MTSTLAPGTAFRMACRRASVVDRAPPFVEFSMPRRIAQPLAVGRAPFVLDLRAGGRPAEVRGIRSSAADRLRRMVVVLGVKGRERVAIEAACPQSPPPRARGE